MLRSVLIFLLVSTLSTIAMAEWNFSDYGSLYSPAEYTRIQSTRMGTRFIRANERTPEDALEIYKGLSEGVYVSVGFERSFLAAAAADKVTHLLIVDMEPKILEFAKYNILLLKVAYDLEDYIYLRMKASHKELVTRFAQANLTERYFEWASQAALFEEWSSLIRESLTMTGHPLRNRFVPKLFQNVNYTENLEQFKKIQSMARAGRIRTVRGNIVDPMTVENIRTKLNGLKISAMDISNAWRWDYLGTMGMYFLLENWSKVINSQTQLILSVFNPKLIFGKRWVYLSFPMLKLVGKSMSVFRVDVHSYEMFGGNKFKKNAFNQLPEYAHSCNTVLFD